MALKRAAGAGCARLRLALRGSSWSILLAGLAGCVSGVGGVAEPVRFSVNDDGVRLEEAGRPVLFFRYRPRADREPWRLDYVHPLWSVAGAVLTEDAPEDHLHHRGIFWAWRRILVDGEQVADGWVGRNLAVETERPSVVANRDGSAQILSTATWLVTLDGIATPIVAESAEITAYPVEAGRRRVELEVALRALRAGVALGGSDDEKGYGGPSVRLAHPDRIGIESGGQTLRAQVAAIQTGETIRFSWSGIPAPWPSEVVVSCVVDGHPWTSWVLRQELSMQNCAVPGRAPLVLPMDRPLRLRMTLVFD